MTFSTGFTAAGPKPRLRKTRAPKMLSFEYQRTAAIRLLYRKSFGAGLRHCSRYVAYRSASTTSPNLVQKSLVRAGERTSAFLPTWPGARFASAAIATLVRLIVQVVIGTHAEKEHKHE